MNSLIHIFKSLTWLKAEEAQNSIRQAADNWINLKILPLGFLWCVHKNSFFVFWRKLRTSVREWMSSLRLPTADTHLSGVFVRTWRESLLFFRPYLWIVKICLWRPTDIFFPSSYKGSEEEAFRFCSTPYSLLWICRARLWEKPSFSCHCTCSSELCSAVCSHSLNLLEIKRVERSGSLSGLESSHPGAQSLVIVLK